MELVSNFYNMADAGLTCDWKRPTEVLGRSYRKFG